MKMEKRIVDLDIAIRSALHHEEPDMARSLILISELHSLAIQPLMLKKLPNIVMTLRKVRKYIGPKTQHPDPKVICIPRYSLVQNKWDTYYFSYKMAIAVSEGRKLST